MTTELRNLYEEIIQDAISEGINGMTPELRKMIKSSPVELRRSMLLDILVENNPEHRLLCSKIQKVVNDATASETKHIKEVVKMLREYVKVSAVEKKEFGEVMTPIELVEEMLDTLPIEVWSNPSLKWLDPCNGVGTFVSVVIERLMKGLEGFEADDKKRYAHIMENMIYVCELQSKNVFLYLYAFDPKDEYALNIYNGSYLDEGFDKHMRMLGVDKFDVIVMNPPYNSGNEARISTLWDKFVIKTINNLNDGGYLVAVHPDGWRRLGGKFDNIKNLIKSKQVLYLELHDISDGMKTFGVQTTYDFYCLHNVPNTMFTKIKCTDGTIERADISKMKFIPNGMYSEFNKLIAKNGEESVKLLHSYSAYFTRKLSETQTEEFIYPIVMYTRKNGSIKFMYSNTNKKGHFEISKVIWSTGGASKPIVDEKGEYGLTQFTFGIVDDITKLPLIQKAMLHPDFLKLMSFSDGITGCRHRYNHNIIATFRKDFWVDFL